MLSYETLDTIADAYNPLLVLAVLLTLISALVTAQWRLLARHSIALCLLFSCAYGFMLLDQQLAIWPAFGLDYSTHTAVAFILMAYLALVTPRWLLVWWLSFLSYLLLM